MPSSAARSAYTTGLLLCCVVLGSTVEYRSLDGTGNNVAAPAQGSAGAAFQRVAGHAPYSRADVLRERANPRSISNAMNVGRPRGQNPRKLSDAHSVWGQFIAHDLTHAVGNRSDPAPIPVPICDAHLDPDCTGNRTIPFWRTSARVVGRSGVRQQLNQVTSYLDGSMVYGSDQETARALRAFRGGRLLADAAGDAPLNTAGLPMENSARRDAHALRMAGDVRANVSPQLLAYHSLFVREHNRYCKALAARHADWDDETLYQEARRRVVAHIQHITYREYLPALLGRPLPLYAGYDPSVNAEIETFFATCAFRYGHAEVCPSPPPFCCHAPLPTHV